MLEKLKILDVCAPWETQQYSIFSIRHFQCDRHPAKSGPRLEQRSLHQALWVFYWLYFSPYVPGILPPWNWRVRRDTVQSSSLYLPLIFTKVGKFNFIKCNSENCLKWCERQVILWLQNEWMRCEFLFFYMVSLNLKITQISGSLTGHANLQ